MPARHASDDVTIACAILHLGWLPSGSQNGFLAIASLIRRTTSSSVGYGDFSAGFSGIGISSMRYAVPGRRFPAAAVVICTRASRLVCVTFGIEHDRRNPLQMVDRRLRHRRPRVGADDQGRVAVAADQHIDRRELARVVPRIAAIERDAERIAGLPAHDDVGAGDVAVAAHRHGDELGEGVHFRGQRQQRGGVHVLAAGHRQAHAEEHAAELGRLHARG